MHLFVSKNCSCINKNSGNLQDTIIVSKYCACNYWRISLWPSKHCKRIIFQKPDKSGKSESIKKSFRIHKNNSTEQNNFITLQGNKKEKALNRKHLKKICSLTILLLETMRDQHICCFFNTQIERFNVLFPIFVYSENFIFQSCSINVILKNIYSVRLWYSCASMKWSKEIRQIKSFKTIQYYNFRDIRYTNKAKYYQIPFQVFFSPCLPSITTNGSEPSKRTLPMTESSASAQYTRWLK